MSARSVPASVPESSGAQYASGPQTAYPVSYDQLAGSRGASSSAEEPGSAGPSHAVEAAYKQVHSAPGMAQSAPEEHRPSLEPASNPSLPTEPRRHQSLPTRTAAPPQVVRPLERGPSAPPAGIAGVPEQGNSARYAGQVLQPEARTLEATEAFVQALIAKLGGRFRSNLTFVSNHPTRRCMYCVEARVRMEFGKLLDILFFPNPEDFALERAMTKVEWLQQHRAVVRDCVEAPDWLDSATGLLVKVPSYILTNITTPVDVVLKGLSPATRQATVDGIGCVLIRQLAAFHGRRQLLQSSLNRRNLVRTEEARDLRWTFREYSYCVRENRLIPVWRQPTDIFLLPPEAGSVAKALASARTPAAANRCGHIAATSTMDIWRLGLMMYELWSGKTFWPNGIIATEVIKRLNTPGDMPLEGRFPFDQDGLKAQAALVRMMLDRNPHARPTAKDLEAKLGSLPETTLPGATYMLMVDPSVFLGYDTTENIVQI